MATRVTGSGTVVNDQSQNRRLDRFAVAAPYKKACRSGRLFMIDYQPINRDLAAVAAGLAEAGGPHPQLPQAHLLAGAVPRRSVD